jgi:NAD(P)H-hydrate epimerase
MLTLTRQQVREVDRRALSDYDMPGIILMENAGRNAAQVIIENLDRPGRPRVVVFCGGGNNGGDGYVIARHMANAGFPVQVVYVKPPTELHGDAAVQQRIAERMGIDMRPWDADFARAVVDRSGVLVDALLGTGFKGAVRAPLDEVIELFNDADHAMRVAVDLPSGLDCDTGQPAVCTVVADCTVTFVASKVGFDAPQARAFIGEVYVADIGVPRRLIAEIAAAT